MSVFYLFLGSNLLGAVYEHRAKKKIKTGLFTHGDGDDRQWRLIKFVSHFNSVKVHPQAKGGGHPTQGLTVGGMTAFGGGEISSVGLDLRKTARGASSPAKPALHIPELKRNSSV
jgi:hypothetical protein